MDERRAAELTEAQADTDLRDTTVGDHDVDLGAVAKFAAALAVVTVLLFGLMWIVSKGFKSSLERRDPESIPIMAENPREAAPGPRLQSDPNRDMAELRAEERAALEGYAWLSPDRTTARIPVSRAMEIVLANGLPKATGGTPPPTPDANGLTRETR